MSGAGSSLPEAEAALGLVARILPFSAVDGPGNRAVVFLQGCDFDCAYCHNPETRALCIGCGDCVAACPRRALSAPPPGGVPAWDRGACVDCGACVAACRFGSSPKVRALGAEATLAEIARYAPFLRGITVSGGECLLQAAYLAELLEASRARGLPGLVDTNGSTPLEAHPRILAAAEGFMLDVKAWDPAEHRALVGADNAPVLANLRLLASRDALYEVRTVVAEGAFDAELTVRETAAVLAGAGARARYKLIRYRPYGVRPDRAAALREPSQALMESLAALARAGGVAEVVIS